MTGLSKKMIRQIYGDEQFMKWRRGFDSPPPPVSSFSSHYPGNDPRYVNYVQDMPISWFETLIRSLAHGKLEVHKKFPKAESLKDCASSFLLSLVITLCFPSFSYPFVLFMIVAGMERTIPYFLNVIRPEALNKDCSVLVASSE